MVSIVALGVLCLLDERSALEQGMDDCDTGG